MSGTSSLEHQFDASKYPNYPDFFKFLLENEVEFVSFRFTDTKGKWQHTALYKDQVNEELIQAGLPFDGSSIAGWKSIDKSDMLLKPDVSTVCLCPFAAQPTAIIFCDIIEPDDGKNYILDPRSLGGRAVDYLRATKIGDVAYFGPELEFFIFDDVRYNVGMNGSIATIDSYEGPYNTAKKYDSIGGNSANLGHRPKLKGGYFPVPPVDSLNDIRGEMINILKEIGLTPSLHHHEVAPSQCELGFEFSHLVQTADNVQKYKYVVHNVADSYGKTASFMPKPVLGDNGSGMHTHQSIWKDGENIFAGDVYAGLSEVALHYIGGIIKHSKSLNAFTNASTNSYKRLVPGFEAPVALAYSSRNRSAAIRIPYSLGSKAKRIELRFPDCTANPYLAFSAMLMAGLDGIKNKIDPGKAREQNLYELSKEQLKQQGISAVSTSLRKSLEALDENRQFLKQGEVFCDNVIDSYINLKMEEVEDYEKTPHPIEFVNYYSV